MSTEIRDTPRWYVIHTHPRQEDRTTINLNASGIETLSPKLRVNKYNEFTGKLIRALKPLFPNYVFVRFKFNELYNCVRFTRGVHSMVCFSSKPAWVEDDIVDLIRLRIGGDGVVRTLEDLKPGDEVVINDGRFRNFCGVFERDMPDADRVRILLSTVSFQAHIVVGRELVKKMPKEKRIALTQFC